MRQALSQILTGIHNFSGLYGGQHTGSSDCPLLGDSFEDSTALAILEDAPGLAQHLLPIPEKPKRQMAGGVAILLPSPSGIQRIFSALARLALLAVKTGLNRPRILSEQSPLTAKVRFFHRLRRLSVEDSQNAKLTRQTSRSRQNLKLNCQCQCQNPRRHRRPRPTLRQTLAGGAPEQRLKSGWT